MEVHPSTLLVLPTLLLAASMASALPTNTFDPFTAFDDTATFNSQNGGFDSKVIHSLQVTLGLAPEMSAGSS